MAWRAAHGVGKTATLSWLLLWFLLSRPFSRVLVVAPAFKRQVGRYLLAEVRQWVCQAPEELPLEVRANSVEVQSYAREWFAIGVQASDPANIKGAHADSVAVLADEAKGLDAGVVAALHGSMTEGHSSIQLIERTYGHLMSTRHRNPVVEYRESGVVDEIEEQRSA